MTKIMFICHGNICRSPMAEFIFKKLAADSGRANKFFVCSSATSREEIGNPIYPPAKRELLSHGISSDGKHAVQLTSTDYDNFDLLIVMDSKNYRNIFRIIGSDPDNKVKKLMDYCSGGDVADPWYTGDFKTTYNDIVSGCKALLNSI